MSRLFDNVRHDYELRHEPEAARRLGEVAWMVIVIASALCAFGAAGYGLWLYIHPPQITAPSVTVKTDASTVDREQLQKIVETLNGRITEFSERVE